MFKLLTVGIKRGTWAWDYSNLSPSLQTQPYSVIFAIALIPAVQQMSVIWRAPISEERPASVLHLCSVTVRQLLYLSFSEDTWGKHFNVTRGGAVSLRMSFST